MESIRNPLSDEDVVYSILRFLKPDQRVYFRILSQEWNQFAGNEKYARWMCIMLNEDGRLYIPPRPPPGLTWLHVLKDLWSLRYLWTPCLIDSTGNEKGAHGAEGDESTPETNDNDVTPIWWRRDPSEALKKYNIGVLVRFRPEKEIQPLLSSGDKKDVGGGKDKFYLPLHQRLAIIRSRDQRKAKNNLRNNKSQISPEVTPDDDDDESNNKDEENNSNNNSNHRKKAPISMKKKTTGALKTLQGEGGWFGTDWKKSAFIEKDNKNGDSLSNNQDNNNDSSLSAHIHDVDPMSARVVAVAPGVGLREFQYDYVLPSRSTQSSVYEASTRRLLMDFLNGINATILVYGQTGSGKTYTMFGEQPTTIAAPQTPVKPPITSSEDNTSSEKKVLSVADMRQARLNKFDNNVKQEQEDQGRVEAAEEKVTEDVMKLSLQEKEQEDKVNQAIAMVQQEQQQQQQIKKTFTYKEKGLRGIVPRAAEEVLMAVSEKRKMGLDASVTVSYVEVFGDDVTDLLHGGARCGHSKVSAQRYVLNGATGRTVESLADIAECLEMGELQKRKAATAMNDRSSRAHALFIMTLQQYDMKTDRKVKSQLFLADLGGSENVKRSEVHHGAMHDHYGHILGTQMREAVYINLGLLALKKCIDALNRGNSYVPYQDSKLTMLLSPALGGDSKTRVVVCGSMDVSDAKETVQALRFGEACGLIANSAGVQARGAAGMLEAMEKEMEELEKVISEKETWVSSQRRRADKEAEEGTVEATIAARGGEIVRVDKIVGAENERARLEELIVKRAELLGEDVDMSLAEAGFGGQFGAKPEALGGHAALRFNAKSQGLKIKGKVVAEWVP